MIGESFASNIHSLDRKVEFVIVKERDRVGKAESTVDDHTALRSVLSINERKQREEDTILSD